MDIYRGVKELKISDEDPVIAHMDIKSEKITVKGDGQIFRQKIHNPNDLLITLRDADSQLFKHVTNEEILREIINMNIGGVKRAPQRQYDKVTGDPTGNKFFILENVVPADRENIPTSFDFDHPKLGRVKMWLSHKYQIRKCWFCGDRHAAICPMKEKIV